jgi:PEGA domain-containing protein
VAWLSRALVALVLLTCALARAQSYDSALLDGVAARDRALETDSESDWRRALQHFARAMAQQPSKEAAFELGQAAAHLKLTADAYAAYETALELGLSGKAKALAQLFIGENEDLVGRVAVTGPAGASLSVDDELRGELPLARPLVVLVGEHQVSLTKPGFRRASLRVDVGSGSVHALALELTAEPATVAAPMPDAQSERPTAAGAHVAETSPRVTAAQRPEQPRGDATPWARPTLIAGSALFVTGIAGWVATSLLVSDARRDLRASCSALDARDPDVCAETTSPRRAQAQAAANRLLTFKNLRWVAIGGAGVGLAAGALGLVPLLTNDSPAVVRGASLELAPGRVAVAWQRRF